MNINNNIDSDEENSYNKHYITLSSSRYFNRNKKIDNSTSNNNQNNSFKIKNQNKKGNTISTQNLKKRKIKKIKKRLNQSKILKE